MKDHKATVLQHLSATVVSKAGENVVFRLDI